MDLGTIEDTNKVEFGIAHVVVEDRERGEWCVVRNINESGMHKEMGGSLIYMESITKIKERNLPSGWPVMSGVDEWIGNEQVDLVRRKFHSLTVVDSLSKSGDGEWDGEDMSMVGGKFVIELGIIGAFTYIIWSHVCHTTSRLSRKREILLHPKSS